MKNKKKSAKFIVPKRKMKELEENLKLNDPFSEECTIELGEKLKCVSCLCGFSKVVIDSNCSLYDKKLFGGFEESKFMSSAFSPLERISLYYATYHTIIKEVINWILPDFHISIHTKPDMGENAMEIIYRENPNLAQQISTELIKNGYKTIYSEKTEFLRGMNSNIEYALFPEKKIKSLRFDISEKISKNDQNRSDFINKLFNSLIKILPFYILFNNN